MKVVFPTLWFGGFAAVALLFVGGRATAPGNPIPSAFGWLVLAGVLLGGLSI